MSLNGSSKDGICNIRLSIHRSNGYSFIGYIFCWT